MNSKVVVMIVVLSCVLYQINAGAVPVGPVAAAYVAPYATSYNSHYVNHAVAAPVVSAPLTAAYASYPLPAAYAAYPYSAPLVLAK